MARRTRLRLTAATAAVTAATLTAGATPAGAAPTLVSTGFGCAPMQVVAVPGTDETRPDESEKHATGLLAQVTNDLDPRNTNAVFVPYIADIVRRGTDWVTSRADGYAKTEEILSEIAARCPRSKVSILGFSQGAGIAGDIATAIGANKGPIPADRVARVALFADPYRTPGAPTPGTMTAGGGIAGLRAVPDFGVLRTRTVSLCNPGDLFCNTDQVATILPNIIGAVQGVSLDNPASVIDAVSRVLGTLKIEDLLALFDRNSAAKVLSPELVATPLNLNGVVEVPVSTMQAVGTNGPEAGDSHNPVQYLAYAANNAADLATRIAVTLANIPALEQTGARHNEYAALPVDAAGTTATEWVAQWIAAATRYRSATAP